MWQWLTLRRLRSSGYETRSRAFRRLIEQGGFAPLLLVSNDSDDDIRWQAVEALAEIADPRGVPSLLERLKDSHFNIREVAIRGLSRTGDPRMVPALLDLLQPDPEMLDVLECPRCASRMQRIAWRLDVRSALEGGLSF